MDVVEKTIEVVPTGASLGADIVGVDLSQGLSESVFDQILQAWHAHLVLRLRGQRIGDEEMLAFSRRFGQLDKAPPLAAGGPSHARHPEITAISNIQENGKFIGGLGNYEAEWHTDMSYHEIPPDASALYALEVPPVGGDTGFANMYAAYETLDKPLRDRIAKLGCKHDASKTSAGVLRKGFQEVTDPREAPGAVHPLVRTHPKTGRKALFLGRRKNAYIPGLSLEESEGLLDALWAHATRPELCWYQKWMVGDLIIWDNRCVLHRRDELDPQTRRLLHRTQIMGSKPF